MKLLPVSKSLQDGWRRSYKEGRYADIEWEWSKRESIPSGEDRAAGEVRQVYDEVRESIKMGEKLFPKGATPGHTSMKGYHSQWKETNGVFQTNKMLRGSHEVEYEVFMDTDTAEGLREEWRRPMHWAGFLVMGANTRLPLSATGIEDWLSRISLAQYTDAIKEYGYDSLEALDAALEADLEEMAADPDVGMKKPHRRLLIAEWKKRSRV